MLSYTLKAGEMLIYTLKAGGDAQLHTEGWGDRRSVVHAD